MSVRGLSELEVKGKTVFVRVDFNVPLNQRTITDDTRMVAALPTIRALLESGAAVVLASHLGRPKGQVNPDFSLAPVAAHLCHLLPNTQVTLAPDAIGTDTLGMKKALEPGQVLVLENLRFHTGETDNDMVFAEALAEGCDLYINDAFGASHRAHASIVGVPHVLNGGGAGLLLEKELTYLVGKLKEPKRPYVLVTGGAKVSDKIPLLENVLDKVDVILVGGAMAYTFLKAQGINMGKSLIEEDCLELAATVLKCAEKAGVDIHLPLDHRCGVSFNEDTDMIVTPGAAIGEGLIGLDIGPETAEAYAELVASAGTAVWNGPMGVFEWRSFCKGTFAVAEAMARCEGITIVGGGDSVSAVKMAGQDHAVDHISTGGGASLELLSGRDLPGVLALS